MNSQQASRNSNPSTDLYTINLKERDRIMAVAYLARSQYLASLFLKLTSALAKLATALTEKLGHRAASTKSWIAH